jgi:chemotaxis protein histidine kinase CheA
MTKAPNMLQQKVGAGRLGALDPAAIAKAEAALKNLSGNFAQWLEDEISKLEAARQTLRAEGASAKTLEGVYMRAHDLKGLGTTYGFPLITRIAASLCMLMDDAEKRERAPTSLIDAHVDAIRAAVTQDIRDDEHPVGRELARTLESQVAACG